MNIRIWIVCNGDKEKRWGVEPTRIFGHLQNTTTLLKDTDQCKTVLPTLIGYAWGYRFNLHRGKCLHVVAAVVPSSLTWMHSWLHSWNRRLERIIRAEYQDFSPSLWAAEVSLCSMLPFLKGLFYKTLFVSFSSCIALEATIRFESDQLSLNPRFPVSCQVIWAS